VPKELVHIYNASVQVKELNYIEDERTIVKDDKIPQNPTMNLKILALSHLASKKPNDIFLKVIPSLNIS